MKTVNAFVLQTSKDYSLPYSVVLDIYEKYGIEEMYQKLEDILELNKN